MIFEITLIKLQNLLDPKMFLNFFSITKVIIIIIIIITIITLFYVDFEMTVAMM